MTALSLESMRKDLGTRSEVCPKHGAFASIGMAINLGKTSREIWTKCQGCADDDAAAAKSEAEARDAEVTRRALEGRLKMTAVPSRFLDRSLDNYHTDDAKQARALDICRAFVGDLDANLRRGSSLVFSGQPGTGKSHLAAAILMAALPKHVGLYCTLMDLVRMLRNTWRKDSEESEVSLLAHLTSLPLIVIDEVGVQYGTDGERTLLFEVMDRRYREQRSTILLTNLGVDDFRVAVGDRVYDRLTEVAKWVSFDWPSHRKQARKEFQQ